MAKKKKKILSSINEESQLIKKKSINDNELDIENVERSDTLTKGRKYQSNPKDRLVKEVRERRWERSE